MYVPLRILVKDSEYKTVRSFHKETSLGELITTVFPNMLEGSDIKPQYRTVDVSICGLK